MNFIVHNSIFCHIQSTSCCRMISKKLCTNNSKQHFRINPWGAYYFEMSHSSTPHEYITTHTCEHLSALHRHKFDVHIYWKQISFIIVKMLEFVKSIDFTSYFHSIKYKILTHAEKRKFVSDFSSSFFCYSLNENKFFTSIFLTFFMFNFIFYSHSTHILSILVHLYCETRPE